MKHRIACLLAAMTVLWSCRDFEDNFPYIGEVSDLAYNSYASQFDYIWKTMSTGYCFWDSDEVPWDDRYDRLLPEFQKLDGRIKRGDTVSLDMIEPLYEQLFDGLLDHHLFVSISNLHPSPSETGDERLELRPGDDEVQSRHYFKRGWTVNYQMWLMYAYIVSEQICKDFNVRDMDGGLYNNKPVIYTCNIVLPDGRIVPYLWQGNARLTEFFDKEKSLFYEYRDIPESWFKTICETPRDSIAGIIVDNRSNTGGYCNDLNHIIGRFIDKPFTESSYRMKDGPGRLEYTDWHDNTVMPNQTLHRSLAAENIPIVGLCDATSISMGEGEIIALKNAIPTCHTIGERTYGATGTLMPDCIDFSYGGPYGSTDDKHYIYTATCQLVYPGNITYEGKGYTPDQIIYNKNCSSPKDYISAALDYIANYH